MNAWKDRGAHASPGEEGFAPRPGIRAVEAEPPRWPGRIRQLATELRTAPAGEQHQRVLSELWPLLQTALQRYARSHAHGPRVREDDVLDIAADKALDLIRRLERGEWDPAALHDAALCAFLAAVARNAVFDLLRRSGREVSTELSEDAAGPRDPRGEAAVFAPVEAREMALAIAACCRALSPTARFVWFLRVFFHLSASDIAGHPQVHSTGPAVDSMLLRCRSHMRLCVTERGFDLKRLPPGTFVALWEVVAKHGLTPRRAHREGAS